MHLKNNTLPAIAASISGGITGIMIYLAVFGLNAADFKTGVFISLTCGFSLLAVLLMSAFSFVFFYIFKHTDSGERQANLLVFSIPSLAVFSMP